MNEEDAPGSPIFKTRPEPPPGRDVYHFGAGIEANAPYPEASPPMAGRHMAARRLPRMIMFFVLVAAGLALYAFLT